MLLRFGYHMITVPVSPSMRLAVLKLYRQHRRRWNEPRHQAHRSAMEMAFYSVVAAHPDFSERPRADAPDHLKRGAA